MSRREYNCKSNIDCITLTIGSGPVVGKTFAVEPGYTCPTIVRPHDLTTYQERKTNPYDPLNLGDSFAVTQTQGSPTPNWWWEPPGQAGDTVSVVRVDKGHPGTAGWAMNLEFECCGE